MSKKPIGSCPIPREFVRWWRNRANQNAEALSEAGKALRSHNFSVTEEQVNARFKLRPRSFKAGEVLAKLQECSIPCYDMKSGELKLGWSPKEFDKLKSQGVESTHQI